METFTLRVHDSNPSPDQEIIAWTIPTKGLSETEILDALFKSGRLSDTTNLPDVKIDVIRSGSVWECSWWDNLSIYTINLVEVGRLRR